MFDKVKSLRDELKMELDKDPHNAKFREEEMILNSAYKAAVLDEEMVLKQKTKIEWLKRVIITILIFTTF